MREMTRAQLSWLVFIVFVVIAVYSVVGCYE